MRTVRANFHRWIPGMLVAFAGVALARALAPSLDGDLRIYVTVAGQLLACLGLLIICLGVRRRLKTSVREGASDSE